MNLKQLATLILSIEKPGLSKVRFAKTIYYVHKELVRAGVMTTEDINYIRMPLGPVPDGFMQLTENQDDIVTETIKTGLSYNSLNYRLRRRRFFSPRVRRNEIFNGIDAIVKNLHDVSTGVLVEKSHEESSWINHKNGQIYSISSRDMRNPLPVKQKGISQILENQKIQASLVDGMLEDIVSESTDLEYPSDGPEKS
jgi:hypothetical protein